MKLSTGILAGGKSTRMGQNKALLQFNNRRFIDRIAEELNGFSETIISAATKGDYEDLGLPVVYDEHQEIGPMEGIYQILKSASEEYVFICGADMPFIKKELVSYMAEFLSSDYDCFCLMDDDHVHPLCAIYSKRALPVIEELIVQGQYRLVNILNRMRTKYIKLEYTCFDKKVVKNINTKDEYKRMVLPVVFCVSGVKDSGKTWLIVKLINEFIKENYSVAVIKHDGHDYVMDYEGTDTYRFREAGAKYSAIFSDTQYSMNVAKKASIEEMIALVLEKRNAASQNADIKDVDIRDVDILIIEGLKESAYPKIEVVRGQISAQSICNPDLLICLATDIVSPNEVKCPVFGLDDIEGLFLCLKRYFGLL